MAELALHAGGALALLEQERGKVWRRQCGVKCSGSSASFKMRLNALSALVVSSGVPRLVQNSRGGSAGHPRRSVSAFRSMRVVGQIRDHEQTARGLLPTQVEEELRGGGEEDVRAGEHPGMGDVLSDRRFAEALRRDQLDIARVGEDAESQHRLDRGPVDPLGPGPKAVPNRAVIVVSYG